MKSTKIQAKSTRLTLTAEASPMRAGKLQETWDNDGKPNLFAIAWNFITGQR